MSAQFPAFAEFPAFVVDAGADYTAIFPVIDDNLTDARERAIAHCIEHLRPKQISHAIYLLDTQKDFDRILAKRNIEKIQEKVWRIQKELAQAEKELRTAHEEKEALK